MGDGPLVLTDHHVITDFERPVKIYGECTKGVPQDALQSKRDSNPCDPEADDSPRKIDFTDV